MRTLSRVQHLYTFAILAIIALVSYGVFYAPILQSDDWYLIIEKFTHSTSYPAWLDPTLSRPFQFIWFRMLHSVFGMNIHAFYMVLGGLNLLAAFLFYCLVSRMVSQGGVVFALIAAAIFLVYPTGYTNMWLTMIGIKVVVCMILLYAWLLIIFVNSGRLLALGGASLLLLVSFGSYDGQFGLVCTWPLILIVLSRQTNIWRRLSLFVPLVLAGVFVVYRMVGQQIIGISDEGYKSLVNIAPDVLISRMLEGYKISLGWSWTTILMQTILPWLANNAKVGYLVLGGITFVLWWLASRIVYRQYGRGQEVEVNGWSLRQRWSQIRSYVYTGLVGLVLVGAGYIPFIAIFEPALFNVTMSRIHIFASIGSAISLVSILMIGSLLFARYSEQAKYLFLVSALPFLLLGVATQVTVQYNNLAAWRGQQRIWQELFSTVPSFRDDTMVLFIMPTDPPEGYLNRERRPLYAAWEVSSALRVLYDNPTLSAEVIFPDREWTTEPILTPKGVFSQYNRTDTPYNRVVTFVYESDTKPLRRLDDLPAELVEGKVGPIKLCPDCVLNEGGANVPLRKLVEN
jgi:hypothetical protein